MEITSTQCHHFTGYCDVRMIITMGTTTNWMGSHDSDKDKNITMETCVHFYGQL